MKRALILSMAGACAVAGAAWSATHHSARATFRVCADPNNLPFSNDKGEGFENHIATLIARDLGERVEYTWWAQRRGFVRNTLNAGDCDVILGVPVGYGMTRTTHPYYRSTYVFVTRRDRGLHIASLDDPALRSLRVGVHLIGDDYANSPAAHSLARRGITSNVVGYTLYGDYSQPNPPARLIEAVEKGDIDVAVAWGPLAGYFARRSAVPLDLRPVTPQQDGVMQYAFAIAMGVRRRDTTRAAVLNAELTRLQPDIDRILADYGVPLLTR
jgi:quinoprotein dehydrogenase-associated probable ABC transporter substrate-binding protein